jgi:ribA/ribD-fused uncharacterized protein
MNVVDSFTGQWAVLSNFAAIPCELGGDTYPTVEHAFHAAKVADMRERHRLYAPLSSDPRKAKAWGATVPLRAHWDEGVAVAAMSAALASKFTNPAARAVLLSTGGAVLIEGNAHHDNRWGDCRNCTRPACSALGTNLLGALLMAIRATLTRP